MEAVAFDLKPRFGMKGFVMSPLAFCKQKKDESLSSKEANVFRCFDLPSNIEEAPGSVILDP
jgi:hypothetical protein